MPLTRAAWAGMAVAVSITVASAAAVVAQQQPAASLRNLRPIVIPAHGFAETPELSKLLLMVPPGSSPTGAVRRIPVRRFRQVSQTLAPQAPLDTAVQSSAPTLKIPSPSLTFAGMTNNCNCSPPDPNGDVGPSNYVQAVNSDFQVYNKFTGAALTPQININTLFSSLGAGSPCFTSNDGDPMVLYDPLADRWLISQFANASSTTGPFYMSVAISKTGDPTGAYYVYCFQTPGTKFPDYPKFGVWPDGYYMTDNQFNAAGTASQGAGVFAFNRAKLLVGDPSASYIYFDLANVDSSIGGLLPADLDGPPPPIGTPNYLSYFTATAFGDPTNGLRVFQFHADFVNTNLSTFTERPESPIRVASFTPFNTTTNLVIPQSGTTRKLDDLSDRLMHRLQYRNFGTNESLVVNHTVLGGSSQAAIRYYQLRRNLPSGNFAINEQATFAPDTLYRWMGSAAMDYWGNLAVGYSVSGTTNFPSIRYAGRLATDPTNQLTQGEATLQTGAGAQTDSGGRWGDYSALTVDPTDDTTFWYTTEYYSATSAIGWKTRIGSFQFTGFGPAPKATIQGNVTDGVTGLPLSNVVVRTTTGFSRATDPAGNYSMTVPPGSYDMSAVATGKGTNTVTGLSVTNGSTVIQNFVIGLPTPILTAGAASVTAESCVPTNGAVDPGEIVTLSLSLLNTGTGPASNAVATLLATGGILSPSGSQSYGTLATGGVAVARSYSFTGSGTCGGAITASLQVIYGTASTGTVTYTLPLGKVLTALTQSFDAVTAPALPAGWATATSGGQSNWVTSIASADTLSNAAFAADNAVSGVNELDSPSLLITGPSARLTFRHNYSLTASTTNSAIGYDGGVLEIKIGGGSYTDIVAAGGAFVSGGYNTTLSGAYGNPLAGQAAWSGLSGGFTTTVANLPASAAGQSVQLRWRCGVGSSPIAPAAPLVSSGTLAYWSFDHTNNIADTVAAYLTATTFTNANTGVPVTFNNGNPGRAINSSGFSTSAGPPTTNYSCYTFSLTVSNGYQASLSNMSFDNRASGTGPRLFDIQISQQSNFATKIWDSGPQNWHGTNTWGTDTFVLTNAALTGTVYFRIYGYAALTTSGTWRIDNVNVQGSVGPAGSSGWYVDTISISDPVCCAGASNQAPVINAASISPASPTTTNDLVATVTSASDPNSDPISFAFQWQQSLNNVSFSNLVSQTASNLAAAVTVAGGYYRVVITPTDGLTNGAPFTTTAVLVQVDADGNGINDDWEVQYFGHIGVNPNADPDGDGQGNLAEFLAVTDPTNAASAFVIKSIVPSGDDLILRFSSATGRAYDVEWAGTMLSNAWSAATTNVPGTGGDVSVTNSGATGGPWQFFRIKLRP